ncbi:MAG: twin transmembrane helix small protein [Robiginitomaculum sp.]
MVFNILMALALLTVLVTLVLGMINLTRKDKASQIKSNKLMRVRVIAQAIAVLILLLIVMAKRQAGG